MATDRIENFSQAANAGFEWAGEIAGFSGYKTHGIESPTGKYFFAVTPNEIFKTSSLGNLVDTSIAGHLFKLDDPKLDDVG